MKKLMMFAAAMTIVGGAYAQCGLPGGQDECNTALVYDFKVSVKTTAGKNYSGKCDDVCYRSKSSKSMKGYLYVCGCTCEEFMEDSTLYLYDKKADQVFEGMPEWEIFNKIGKKNLETEGLFGFEDDYGEFVFTAAGFGKVNKKDGVLKTMSGSLVGSMEAPLCEVACDIGDTAVAYPACDWYEDGDVPTIAFGTWSLKHNKKLSQKYFAGLWEPGM